MLQTREQANSGDSSSNRKLAVFINKVKTQLLPVNQNLLNTLQLRLLQGQIDSPELLLKIKSDSGLFIWSLAHVLKTLKARGQIIHSLAELSMQLNQGDLGEFILQPRGPFPTYTFESASKFQKLRMKENLLAAGAAEVIAQEFSLDPDLGFTYTLLRQLGLSLIAWHASDIYNASLEEALLANTTLEDRLTRSLGFAPALLATKVLTDLGLPEELLPDLHVYESAEISCFATEADFLRSVSLISESYARSTQPDLYPQAHYKWQATMQQLGDAMGAEGVLIIENKVKRNTYHYLKHSNMQEDPDLQTVAVEHPGQKLMLQNTYVQQCPKELQELFAELYEMIVTGTSAPRALAQISRQIIPKAGFLNGAIYLFEDDTYRLIPRYQLGQRPLENYPVFETLREYELDNQIASAFYGNFPTLQMSNLFGVAQVSSIAAALGNQRKSGVLYLEIKTFVQQNTQVQTMLVFKAILKALGDCMGL